MHHLTRIIQCSAELGGATGLAFRAELRGATGRAFRAAPCCVALACAASTWLAVAVTGCDSSAAAEGERFVTPPRCTAVQSFGNGATCSASQAQLEACGTAPRRACVSGWLCFDAPELADCGCTTDQDCSGRTAYINAARIAKGKAPLSSRCDGGRCAGQP